MATLGLPCFSDDTGLEIDVNGARVYARYAGPAKDLDNIDKVLHELEGINDRGAQFRTAVALQWNGKYKIFEGIVRGIVERMGAKGFGYDPIFTPEGFPSFAQMTAAKNASATEGRAIKAPLIS